MFLLFYSFQSEKETGYRNYAIGYYLKEKKVSVFFGYCLFYKPNDGICLPFSPASLLFFL